MGTDVTLQTTAAAVGGAKAAHRAMWAIGDYDRFARATVWELGPTLVEACRITRGQRVLECGRRQRQCGHPRRHDRRVRGGLGPDPGALRGRTAWRRGGGRRPGVGSKATPRPSSIGDATFDTVTSCFGAMFAPDQQAVARELTRVCRPGGTNRDDELHA